MQKLMATRIKMCERFGEILIIIFCVASILSAYAGSHYCYNSRTDEIDIAKRHQKDETLTAELEPSSTARVSPRTPANCQWEISCFGLRQNAPMQMALIAGRYNSNIAMHYQMGEHQYDVSNGLMHGITLFDDSCIIKVSASMSSKHPPEPPSLRVVLLQSNICARDFLYFQGGCYTASGIRQSFKDFSSSILGSAQLASFSSKAEISSFIEA
uniref:CUB domain-containing protein n=1 Tax=Macrostomum lignano TaxID=282301 RepID=A0A1I8IM50_9PLAT